MAATIYIVQLAPPFLVCYIYVYVCKVYKNRFSQKCMVSFKTPDPYHQMSIVKLEQNLNSLTYTFFYGFLYFRSFSHQVPVFCVFFEINHARAYSTTTLTTVCNGGCINDEGFFLLFLCLDKRNNFCLNI